MLPTFQPTGIKLKLLSALYNGRFCLVNPPMIENTGMEQLCTVSDSTEHMRENLIRLMKNEFTPFDISIRQQVLDENFSNKKNAEKLIDLLVS